MTGDQVPPEVIKFVRRLDLRFLGAIALISALTAFIAVFGWRSTQEDLRSQSETSSCRTELAALYDAAQGLALAYTLDAIGALGQGNRDTVQALIPEIRNSAAEIRNARAQRLETNDLCADGQITEEELSRVLQGMPQPQEQK